MQPSVKSAKEGLGGQAVCTRVKVLGCLEKAMHETVRVNRKLQVESPGDQRCLGYRTPAEESGGSQQN